MPNWLTLAILIVLILCTACDEWRIMRVKRERRRLLDLLWERKAEIEHLKFELGQRDLAFEELAKLTEDDSDE